MKSFSDIIPEYDGDTLLIQVNFEHSVPCTTIFTLFQQKKNDEWGGMFVDISTSDEIENQSIINIEILKAPVSVVHSEYLYKYDKVVPSCIFWQQLEDNLSQPSTAPANPASGMTQATLNVSECGQVQVVKTTCKV